MFRYREIMLVECGPAAALANGRNVWARNCIIFVIYVFLRCLPIPNLAFPYFAQIIYCFPTLYRILVIFSNAREF